MPDHPAPENHEYITAEYAAGQAAYLQYDAFRWQSGAILIAGAFVFLGFLASSEVAPEVFFAGALVVTSVLSIWLLYAYHYRALYLFKLDRLNELEIIMNAQQHRRFNSWAAPDKIYPRQHPKGHHLDAAVYSFTSVAAPGLALAKASWTWWLLVPIALTGVVVAYALDTDRRNRNWLSRERAEPASLGAEPRTPSETTPPTAH